MSTQEKHLENSGSVDQTSSVPWRVLIIEHEDDTDAGLIGAAARARGAQLSVVNPRGGELPSPLQFDALIVLGSVESAYDPTIATWFDAELDVLRAADQGGVPILGICFGAQALAVALGGSVAKAPYGEYGWKMVDTSAPDIITEGPWFQWHTDAITPPPDAEVLATSECCVQAYRLRNHLAVQFHPEVQLQQAVEWPASDPDGLGASGHSAQDMVDITQALLPDATRRATALWHTFVSLAHQPATRR
jgi:GMP synthase-like glutamine amidotransferase